MTPRENYNAIKEGFEKFVKAWATADVDDMNSAVVENVNAYFSIFDSENCMNRAELKKNLSVRTHKTTFSKIDIVNYVCLTEGEHAQQTAYLNGIFSDDSDGKYEHYSWSGQMANHWVKTEDGWKMDEMRFDQNLDDAKYLSRKEDQGFIVLDGPGNKDFVSNWHGITDRAEWFVGCPLPAIVSEYDAPWIKIKNRDEFLTDEEQIAEVFFKYCWAIDTDCFILFPEIFSKSLIADIFWGKQDYRHICATLKINRSGSRRVQHMGDLGRIKIEGDKAYCEFYSKAPATFCSYELNAQTQDESSDWSAYRWICTYVKEDGKWLISRFYCIGPEFKGKELRAQEFIIPEELKK